MLCRWMYVLLFGVGLVGWFMVGLFVVVWGVLISFVEVVMVWSVVRVCILMRLFFLVMMLILMGMCVFVEMRKWVSICFFWL